MADDAQPGVRVKVRFAGQDVDGFVIERAATTEHTGRLQPLRRVVSAEPVLTPDVAALTGAVAARYAGTRSDVLRLAVPPRHATAEKQAARAGARDRRRRVDAEPASSTTRRRRRSSTALRRRRVPAGRLDGRCPATTGPTLLAEAVVADRARRPRRAGLRARPPRPRPARRGADRAARRGPPRRARPPTPARRSATAPSWPSRAERVRVVVGTRAAAFAPVHDLGLVAIWDDGDDLHAEPRAPYPHAREVLLMRAQETGCAAVLGGARPQRRGGVPPAHRLGHRGGRAPRACVRERISVGLTGDSERDLDRDPRARSARLPSEALQLLREAVQHGPVLVQAPRVGLRDPAGLRPLPHAGPLPVCPGPLRLRGPARAARVPLVRAPRRRAGPAPSAAAAACARRCSATPRTAEEIGRAFPGVTVRSRPSGERVLAEVDDQPAIVVATPGRRAGGAGRLRRRGAARHLAAAGPRRPARHRGGAAPLGQRRRAGAPAAAAAGCWRSATRPTPALQALVRWDPAGFARREIDERVSAHLPPASRVATVTGEPGRPRGRPADPRSSRPAPRCSARSRCDEPRDAPRRGSRCATSSGSRARPARRCPHALQRAAGACARPASCRTVRVAGRPGRARLSRTRLLDLRRRRPRLATDERSSVAVQAHPALRRPGAAHAARTGRRLRQGAAHARAGPHRHDARGARRRASPRRRSASGCGCSPGTSTASSATWSTRS